MGMDYDRLLKAAKEMKGWRSATEIADGLTAAGYEVSPQTLTNWATRGISKEGRLNAARIIGCRPLWLGGDGGPMADIQEPSNISYGIHIPNGMVGVPIITWVQAGTWRDATTRYPYGGADEYVLAHHSHGPDTFAVRIVGNSMEPEFREHDIVVIDPDVTPNPGDYVVARNHEEAAVFKKYRPRGLTIDGTPLFELVPLNADYAVIRSDEQPIQIIGTMVEHTRFRRQS